MRMIKQRYASVMLTVVLFLCGNMAAAGRPNFIFIQGEAQGWASMSVQLDPDHPESRSRVFYTPTLERLASEGMRFSSFYAPSPRCTPSRVAYVTGKSPAQLHMTFTSNRGSAGRPVQEPIPSLELSLDETTIAELLEPAGYVSAHFGKWHMGKAHPSKHGFAESDGPTSNSGPENSRNPNPKQAYGITQSGIDFMSRQVAAGKPFYLQLSHYGGRSAADALRSTYETMQSRAKGRDDKSVGAAAVALDMDTTIRMLLAKVDELGIADKTYIFYTADHGTPGRNGPLQGGKGGLWDGGIRIPLLVRGPGIKGDICSRVRTTGVDLLPTIADLAGVADSLPGNVEGGSLVPVLTNAGNGVVKRPREEVVFHFPHYDKDSLGPVSAILLGNLKLIRAYEGHRRLLYDLSSDIGERRDLSASMPEKVSELDERLSQYLKAVNAQMPTEANADFDPSAVRSKGKGGGQKRGGRKNKEQ
jgi:arylsulfatase A